MAEIQGKSILVRVSARFELATVHVNGSRLYLHVWAVFITKQKSLGRSKTSKWKRTFEFVESIARKDQLNIHRLFSSSSYKYSRKSVSRSVLWVLRRTGAITHKFLGAQPKIQSHMRPVSR